MQDIAARFPLPGSVLDGLRALRAMLAPGASILLAPSCYLAKSLLEDGSLSAYNVLGISDIGDHALKIMSPQPDISISALDSKIDALLLCDLSSSRRDLKIDKKMFPNEDFAVYNLSENFDPSAYRDQIANFIYSSIIKNTIEKAEHVEICIPQNWGFGDRLCAMSAARTFAKLHPEHKIHFNEIHQIRNCYGDSLITAGRGIKIDFQKISTPFYWWEGENFISRNYLDNYLINLGVDAAAVPGLDLPVLEPLAQLRGKQYAVLQPFANTSYFGGPPLETAMLQKIINGCPVPVYLPGKREAGDGICNIDPSFAGNELDMLKLIAHAALVIGPRSASAHIASAYHIPTLVWVPDDQVNWHLDYPDWDLELVFTN